MAFGFSGGPDLSASMVGGRYYRLPNGGLSTSAVLSNARLRAIPKYIPSTIVLGKLGAEITTIGDAVSVLRLGIYGDTDGRPGALILDAGTISGNSATVQEISISQGLNPGWYWFAAAVQGVTVTQPTVRVLVDSAEINAIDAVGIPGGGSALCYYVDGITGALPASFGTPAAISALTPAIFGRVE